MGPWLAVLGLVVWKGGFLVTACCPVKTCDRDVVLLARGRTKLHA